MLHFKKTENFLQSFSISVDSATNETVKQLACWLSWDGWLVILDPFVGSERIAYISADWAFVFAS